eukprot:3740489-Prymnesium_polylepis.1
MRASRFPNPRAHLGMRVVCVRPRPKISFAPPNTAHDSRQTALRYDLRYVIEIVCRAQQTASQG